MLMWQMTVARTTIHFCVPIFSVTFKGDDVCCVPLLTGWLLFMNSGQPVSLASSQKPQEPLSKESPSPGAALSGKQDEVPSVSLLADPALSLALPSPFPSDHPLLPGNALTCPPAGADGMGIAQKEEGVQRGVPCTPFRRAGAGVPGLELSFCHQELNPPPTRS